MVYSPSSDVNLTKRAGRLRSVGEWPTGNRERKGAGIVSDPQGSSAALVGALLAALIWKVGPKTHDATSTA